MRAKKVEELAKRNPPVDPREAMANSILDAFRQGVNLDDVRAGMAKVSGKIREGDLDAMRFVQSLAQASARKPAVSVRGDNNTVNVNPTFITDNQRHIVALLASKGPMDALALATELRCLQSIVHTALDHDWFQRGIKGKYTLTDSGVEAARLIDSNATEK